MSNNHRSLDIIFFGLIIYAAIRFFSFCYPPAISIVNSLLGVLIAVSAIFLIFKKDYRGWLIIALEILLGGSGNFLSVGPIALRTVLLIGSLSIWLIHKITNRQISALVKEKKQIIAALIFMGLALGFGVVSGVIRHHALNVIFSESIPYAYLLYYFPLKELLKQPPLRTELKLFLLSAIIGNFIFSLGTFIYYAGGIGYLQDIYYHWFRDVAGGKITDLGDNYWRVVLSEQLALIPLLLWWVGVRIKKMFVLSQNYDILAIIALLFTYAFNLTRAYLLGLVGGLVILIFYYRTRRALGIAALTLVGVVISFSLIHSIASHDHSLGLEFFGLRVGSIVAPRLEDSSLSRLLLLPEIIKKIKTHPLLGVGLGDTVTVFSPVVKQFITTTQFDWGWLQIQAELGIIGSLAWLILLGVILKQIIISKNAISGAMFLSLIIATITAPVLSNVLGIIFLVCLYACPLPDYSVS